MQIDASHIVALLQELGDDDATCRQMSLRARRGEPIMDVCAAALRALVDDKQRLQRLVIEIASGSQD